MKTTTAIALGFSAICAGVGFYTYHYVIKMDLNTPIKDPSLSARTRIGLLETGIENHTENLRECRSTLDNNKDKFENYIDRTKGYVSRANDEISFIEGKVLQAQKLTDRAKEDNQRLLDAVEDRNQRITELQNYIRDLQNEKAQRQTSQEETQ